MNVTFEMEKATKNTIRFTEVLNDELDAPKIGTIYVPKATLSEIGWKSGMKLIVGVAAGKEN
ncbi:MAG: hypothetical protein LUG62_00825 [Clostridiales bacterium]|nr:hypothetical protein [Clostridiales bacterium]